MCSVGDGDGDGVVMVMSSEGGPCLVPHASRFGTAHRAGRRPRGRQVGSLLGCCQMAVYSLLMSWSLETLSVSSAVLCSLMLLCLILPLTLEVLIRSTYARNTWSLWARLLVPVPYRTVSYRVRCLGSLDRFPLAVACASLLACS